MSKPGKFLSGVSILGLLVTTVSAWHASADDDRTDAKVAEPIPVDVVQELKPPVRPYMQAKLINSQRVLEGLVTHDFEQIREAANNLKMMSLKPPEVHDRDEYDREIYEHFRVEFMRLSGQLELMAEAGNLEGAAFIQQNLNANCIACHKHMRDEADGKSPTRSAALR